MNPGQQIDAWADYATDSVASGTKKKMGWLVLIPTIMLFCAAIPDTMFAAILKQLFVDRYGVSDSAAHLFMAVNIIGVIGGVFVMKRLRHMVTPIKLLFIAAIAEAALLLLMGLPIGFIPTLLVRVVEGGTDLILLAVPLTLIANELGEGRQTQGFGIGAMTLLIGLAVGAILGGFIASAAVFSVGAGLTLIIAIIAATQMRRPVSNPIKKLVEPKSHKTTTISTQAWCGSWLMASDRGLSALLATTIPLALASGNLPPQTIGIAIAICLAIMALGSWPAAWLADRTSVHKIRILATSIYAFGFFLLAIGPLTSVAWLMPNMAVIGIGAAGLMPTALTLGSQHRANSSEVALMEGASQIGYTLAVLAAALMLYLLSGPLELLSGPLTYRFILSIALGLFIAINVTSMSRLNRLSATSDREDLLKDKEIFAEPLFSFEPINERTFFDPVDVLDAEENAYHEPPLIETSGNQSKIPANLN